MEQDETKLIARILRDDEAAYGELIDRYKEGLYRHCFRFTQNEDDAEDIAQQAFIDAYVHLDRYDSRYRFSTWLYKIATNLALTHLRKRRDLKLSDKEISAIISNAPDAEQLALHEELRGAVSKLPRQQRTAVELHYWQGKPYDTIAAQMGTSTGTVKSWISRAKKRLREAVL